jgi:hypothetical protein
MANKWLSHVRKTLKLKKNKGKPFGAVLKAAKKTYKARGGADERITPPDVDSPVPVTVPLKDEYGLVKPTEGGRRTRRTRRRSRHTRK